MKENITKFDLEDAFKALDEIEIPTPKRGIRANRLDLKETLNKKPQTDSLLEDYYDISNPEELNDAKEERDAEVAKAKLARIEKIVDLNAESPEDLLPAYVGKTIIQCPQCLTLFYKDEADIVPSEADETTVNVGEVCQHCGNDSGYTLIGKVAGIEPEEASKFGVEETEPEFEEEEEVEVEEKPEESEKEEEAPAEESEEAPAEEEEEEIDLDALTKAALGGEEEEEEKKEESFTKAPGTQALTEASVIYVKGNFVPGEGLSKSYAGYENPEYRWNGWRAPSFEKDIALNIIDDYNKSSGKELAYFDDAADTFYITNVDDESDTAEVVGKDYTTADGAKHLYTIGTGWTWDIAEDNSSKLNESSDLDTLLDSPNYKAKVSDSVIDAYLNKVKQRRNNSRATESVEDVKDTKSNNKSYKVEDVEIAIDDIDEESANECLTEALRKVYENVKDFKLNECRFNKDTNKLTLEGTITFNSGKTRAGKYTFNKAIVTENNKVKLVGNNNLFEGTNKCTLIGTLDKANCLTTDAVTYKGFIGKDLVEGFAHKNNKR